MVARLWSLAVLSEPLGGDDTAFNSGLKSARIFGKYTGKGTFVLFILRHSQNER